MRQSKRLPKRTYKPSERRERMAILKLYGEQMPENEATIVFLDKIYQWVKSGRLPKPALQVVGGKG